MFFAELHAFAQGFDFKHNFTIPEQNQLWIPDNTGNVYLYGKKTLTKASQGQLPSFSQSIKSIGNIDQILPVNALKTYLFSKDQQQLCLIDNTLSMQSQCLDLEEFDILYALACAISSRPDLVYVYDQFNSSLYLIDTKNNTIVQKVSNLEGVLGHQLEISEMLEYNNDLFIKTIQNEIDAKIHYMTIGYKNNRPYQIVDNDLPEDFDWRIYCELNKDVKAICNNAEDAKMHYLRDGITQERRYQVPENEIPDDFNWQLYLDLNNLESFITSFLGDFKSSYLPLLS